LTIALPVKSNIHYKNRSTCC